MTVATEDVLRRVQAAAEAGELLGVELEWYVSGGLPPPHTRSDQLRLRVEDGREAIVFARERWDVAFDPANVHDKWDLPADAESTQVQDLQAGFRSADVIPAIVVYARDGGLTDADDDAVAGDATTTRGSAPAARAAASTQSTIRRPSTGCRCFGSDDFMRVPSPAAITAAAIGVSVTAG